MITEDYVSFEVAKLLNDKGFKFQCRAYYTTNGRFIKTEMLHNWDNHAPTLQMALRWLDEKGIYISAVPFDVMQRVSDKIVRFMANVFVKHPDYLDNLTIGVFDSRQEATNAAILYVLNSLESLTIYSSQNP